MKISGLRLQLCVLAAVLFFCTGSALADTNDDTLSDSGSGSGFSLGSASGLLEAGGAAALAGGLIHLFAEHSAGAQAAATTATPAAAPEISTSGSAAGLALALGGLMIANGRRRRRA